MPLENTLLFKVAPGRAFGSPWPTWESITFVKEDVEILIARSKTDQGGDGQVCAIPYGDGLLCPVTALITWREQSRCESGHVFRHIKKKRCH